MVVNGEQLGGVDMQSCARLCRVQSGICWLSRLQRGTVAVVRGKDVICSLDPPPRLSSFAVLDSSLELGSQKGKCRAGATRPRSAVADAFYLAPD